MADEIQPKALPPGTLPEGPFDPNSVIMPTIPFTDCKPREPHGMQRFHYLRLNTGNPKQPAEWTGKDWIIGGRTYTTAEAVAAGYSYIGPNWDFRDELPR